MQDSYAVATGMTPSGYLPQLRANSPLFKIFLMSSGSIAMNVFSGHPCWCRWEGIAAHWQIRSLGRFARPPAVKATRLHIVSYLGCSVGIARTRRSSKFAFLEERVRLKRFPLLAGRDTAEWAIDRADVALATLHLTCHHFQLVRGGRLFGPQIRDNPGCRSWATGRRPGY